MRIRFTLPEPGLSRAARWCLAGSFLLILVFFFVAGIWLPVSRVADVTGTNPRIDPPVSTMALWDHGEEDRMLLSMDRGARLWRRGKPFDPAGLEGGLREAILGHERRCRMEGKNSTDEISAGMRASKLALTLRVDRAAPWGAVHDVVRRAGQEGIYRVLFLARPPDVWASKWLQAYLPTADRDYAYVTARVGRDGGILLDGREVPDLTEAIKAARHAREDDELAGTDLDVRAVAGLIDADRAAPFEAVVRALDAFECAGIVSVDLRAESVRAVVVPRPR